MSRKGENIYKRKDGRWEGRIIVKHNCGKAVYKSFYGNSYKAVKAKMAQYSPMSARGDLENRVTKKISVDDYAEQWLYSVKLRCKVSTYNKYRGIYRNHIFPEIGDYNISDVTAEDAMNIISKKSFLSSQTQNDILLVIKMILSYAALNKCETASLKGLTVHRDDTKMRVITAKEQNLLIDFLTQNPDLCKIGVYLSLCTGIRIGELCALKRKNISFDNKILYVSSTMQRIQIEDSLTKTEVIITEPKSKSSIREIPLNDELCSFLKKYYDNLPTDAFLLTGKNDRFIEPRLLEYKFKKYIKECLLDNINFHALRHTFATRCVENGFEIKTLSEILGHVNVNITLNRYVHSSMEMKRINMERMSKIFR